MSPSKSPTAPRAPSTLLGPSAHRTRPEALGALLRTGDVAAIDALRARHERGLSNLRTALNTSVERFGALQLEAALGHHYNDGSPDCTTGGVLERAEAESAPFSPRGELYGGEAPSSC